MLTQPQGLFCFSQHPAREGLEGHSQESWPQMTKEMFVTFDVMFNKSWGKGGGRGGCLELWHAPSQVTINFAEPRFPRSGWTSACHCEVMNEFFVVLCLQEQLLLYLASCL